MKKCIDCNLEYDDDARFCPKCGSELVSDKIMCSACGAALPADAKFCPKCGAKTVDPNVCAACGAALAEGNNFCPNCGAARGSSTAATPKKNKKPIGETVSEYKNKVIAFEKNHSVIVNALVIMLAVVVLFVSLFAPIKMSAAGVSGSYEYTGYDLTDDYTVDQSIYQVLAAWGYADLDTNDSSDNKKIKDLNEDFTKVMTKANSELQKWIKRNPDATDDEIADKTIDIVIDYISDCNIMAFLLANTIDTSDDIPYTLRSETITALVFATIVAIIHLALAIVSIVFIILAILGMVRKKTVPINALFKSTLIPSGVALILLAVAPNLINLGGMFAVALTVALTYFVYGICASILQGKGALCIVKRSVCAALAITSFFLLCGWIFNMQAEGVSGALAENEYAEASAPLGGALGAIITSMCLLSSKNSITGKEVEHIYSQLSTANAIIAIIVFVLAMAVMFAAMFASLSALSNAADKAGRIQVLPLVGGVILFIGVLVVGIISAAVEVPDFSHLTSFSQVDYSSVAYKFFANAQVYVSLVFAVANVIFGALFCPTKKTR